MVDGHVLGNAWHWLTPLLVFGAIPVLDHLIGQDRANPFPQKTVETTGLRKWQLITWACVPLQIGLVVWEGGVIAHGDHHYQPNRPYPCLRHFEESPQLPTGYAGMILLALVTPLWRSIMDKRARAANRQT